MVLMAGVAAWGHEIPREVTVRMVVRVLPGRVQVAARVPLKAMRDVEFPEAGGGYLDVARMLPQLNAIATTWVGNAILLREGERELGRPRVIATRLAVESDRTFGDWKGEAGGDLGKVVWDQLWLDVWMEAEGGGERISIWPGMERLGLKVVTFLSYSSRVYELQGAAGWVELDPSWWGSARRFVGLGFWHILDGADHLLFLLCLVVGVRGGWRLVQLVSAFTVGHSLTLMASALGWGPEGLWFPALVELMIAGSIVWMAVENVVEVGGRWWVVAAFGLVHGFGFSFALRESLQFAGGHVGEALVAFNLGVEAGQLMVVGAGWGVLRMVVLPRIWVVVVSVVVGHTGWHWVWERWEVLRRYWG